MYDKVVFGLVVVIYTTAGTHPIQNDYSHGSRFLCQKVYIHGCRASSGTRHLNNEAGDWSEV